MAQHCMEGMGEETLSFPLLKSGKRQKVHLGRSVSTHFIADCWLSINGCSHLKNKKTVWQWFDGIKQHWLAQKFGLRWLQRLYEIQAESPSFSSPLSARRKEAPLARGREGGGGRRNPHLTLVIVRMFNTYIYPFDEWRILILKLKVSRDYFLFMEANKMK